MRPTYKILAVDDNPVNLEILKEIFADRHRLKTATNGPDAIRIAKKFRPGIVLLDVMMPGVDGIETCRSLRQLPGLEHTRIIMVSAKAMPSEQAAGFEAGADDYVTKPFDETELLAIVRRYHDPTARETERSFADQESG